MKRILLLILLFFTVVIPAQTFNGGFTFNFPSTDTTSGEFLPRFAVQPIPGDDFISVNPEGHFSTGGKEIRFWGANMVGAGAFPDTSKSGYIAGRLRKFGFNLIRFHHLDNPWGSSSLFEYGTGKDTRHLNPVTLDKLDFLISRLKENGIYINMNLNVSRTFKVIDGVQGADSIIDYGKGVTKFDPYLVQLQKEYAMQLLTHINPYTGKSLADDPVMAMVETVNENSLYRMWRDNKLKSFSEGGSIIIRHVQMLDSMWISFLKNKYATTNALAAKWNEGTTPDEKINFLRDGNFESPGSLAGWQMELHEGNLASAQRDTLNPFSGTASAAVTVTKANGIAWNLQWKQPALTFKKDSLYTVEFTAKADSGRVINVAVMRNNEPWTFYTGKNFSVTSEWKSYSFSFKSPENNDLNGRLTFQFASTGTYWFDDISITKSPVKGLLTGESLENLNVKRTEYQECNGFSDNRVKDISEFYMEIEKNFYIDMKNYLVNTIKVKVPVTGTNWNIGAADLSAQDPGDYVDNHSYWDHPSFPNEPWSGTDWNINNNAMVNHPQGGTIAHLFAGTATEGKPYTISEYNHAFPNQYQSEMPLFITAYSSFHYADGIMFFDYGSNDNWDYDKIDNYFDIHRNNVLMSLMPSCAYAYRSRLISPASETIMIDYSQETLKLFPKFDTGSWTGYSFYPQQTALQHAVRNRSFKSSSTTDFSSMQNAPVSPYVSDTGELILNTDGLLTVTTNNFTGMSGYLNSFPGTGAGALQLNSADDFGSITWLSLTGDSLSSSSKSLLTVSSKIQNTGMIWDGTISIHNNWGTAPTVIYPLKLSLSLKIHADSIYVYSLDNKGNPKGYTKYTAAPGNIFDVSINQSIEKTTWFGIEKFGEGITTGLGSGSSSPAEFRLEQNYPNPFNNSTVINYSVAEIAPVTLEIYDILGGRVKTLVNEIKGSGKYSVQWNGMNDNGSEVVSGIYFAALNSGGRSLTKKIILLK